MRVLQGSYDFTPILQKQQLSQRVGQRLAGFKPTLTAVAPALPAADLRPPSSGPGRPLQGPP